MVRADSANWTRAARKRRGVEEIFIDRLGCLHVVSQELQQHPHRCSSVRVLSFRSSTTFESRSFAIVGAARTLASFTSSACSRMTWTRAVSRLPGLTNFLDRPDRGQQLSDATKQNFGGARGYLRSLCLLDVALVRPK
jgi:hypothetical protein